MKRSLATVIALAPLFAYAGGSNYGIKPGTIAHPAGKVSEWPVPTPRFARDPAIAPDGNIYISVMSGNKVARFALVTASAFILPLSTRPLVACTDEIVIGT